MVVSPGRQPRTTLIAGISPAMLQVAGELTKRGERVALFFSTKERLQELTATMAWSKESALPLVASVTDGKSVVKAFEAILEWTQRLDGFIYNVGIEPSGAAEAFSGAELVRVMGLNFYGFVNCFSLTLPFFKRAGRGQAVVISSTAALSLEGQPAAYAASRAALQIYLRALRRELTGADVMVTELYLGYTQTARGRRKLSRREVVEGVLQVLRSRPAKYVVGIA
jgi:NAD(P)-dependent dehydrogenase (short-subunit alcohol dehydrogenase family)